MERLSKARDLKDAIHRAAKASFDALGFRVQLAKEETLPVSITQPVIPEMPVAEVKPVEQIVAQPTEEVVEHVTEQITEQPAEQPVVQEAVESVTAPVGQSVEQIAEQSAIQSPDKPKNKKERKRRQRIGEVKNAA